MDRYRRIADAHCLPLGWSDINTAPELFERHGIDFDTAMRRLHAIDDEGRLIRGVDVFPAIWRHLPRHRWAAAVVAFPPVRPFAWFVYECLVAPLVYRWSRRRWRRLPARGAAAPR
jgi:predicted DCC family thiol-disulfide oxidoreductase YuxK